MFVISSNLPGSPVKPGVGEISLWDTSTRTIQERKPGWSEQEIYDWARKEYIVGVGITCSWFDTITEQSISFPSGYCSVFVFCSREAFQTRGAGSPTAPTSLPETENVNEAGSTMVEIDFSGQRQAAAHAPQAQPEGPGQHAQRVRRVHHQARHHGVLSERDHRRSQRRTGQGGRLRRFAVGGACLVHFRFSMF